MSDISERRDREIERRKNRKTHQPMPRQFCTSVVGTKHIEPQLLVALNDEYQESLYGNDGDDGLEVRLRFERQPNNEHDPNAVAVMWGEHHVGHITRPVAMRLAPEMDAGATWAVRIDGINFYDDQPVGVAITATREDT